jgi:hypothetical protein
MSCMQTHNSEEPVFALNEHHDSFIPIGTCCSAEKLMKHSRISITRNKRAVSVVQNLGRTMRVVLTR